MQMEHLMQLCDDLQQCIYNEVISIEKTINRSEPYNSVIFTAPVVLDFHMDKKKLNKLRGQKGVYIFIIEEPMKLSASQIGAWNKVGGAGFKTSRAIDIIENECLYLGSCVSKSLYVRIGEHYKEKGGFTSLKLRHPSREILLKSVRATAFPIMKEYSDKQCRILLPLIEKGLHSVFVPLAGSSRV